MRKLTVTLELSEAEAQALLVLVRRATQRDIEEIVGCRDDNAASDAGVALQRLSLAIETARRDADA